MSNWENNAIQFPRLLAEIMATQDAIDIPALAESMDLAVDEVGELFDRADAAWQRIKAGYSATIELPMNGFDHECNVVSTTTATLTLEQIADIVDHARQLILVRQSARRSSGDTEGALAELEEALEATGLLDTPT